MRPAGEADRSRSAGPAATTWHDDLAALATRLESGLDGLTSAAAADRLATVGPNSVGEASHRGALRQLARQFENPIVLILLVAATISLALRQWVDAGMVLTIVLGSVALGFFQEYRASAAVDALKQRLARGVRHFGYLLIRVMVLVMLFVLSANLMLDRPVIDSLLFAAALAVGLSPELLPAIVTVTLPRLSAPQHGVIAAGVEPEFAGGCTCGATEGQLRSRTAKGDSLDPDERHRRTTIDRRGETVRRGSDHHDHLARTTLPSVAADERCGVTRELDGRRPGR